MNINNKFSIKRQREIKELNGTLYEMVHNQTGAELIWLDNKEENKLFSVAFKTLPEDDTGVFHILEHSVLCGSDKYPVKEPFVELIKSSMNTFLNAMTFSDKTMYPISSRNKQDYLNLTEVYLDAVFKPAILTKPDIFYQEGWHIEYDGKNTPSYKGVVFNEMKGATSSVDEVCEIGMNRLLYDENCYQYVSGGDPVSIPNLSYEQFVDTYKRFYHPSNAKFYLDGDIPLEETLELIASYLDSFEKSDEKHEVVKQTLKPLQSAKQYYELGQDEDENHKVQFTLGKIVGTYEDKVKGMAISVLADYLAGSNDSVLKRALLEKGLGQDVIIALLDGIYQNWFVLKVSNTDEDKKDEIMEVIRSVVNELLEKGLDKEELEASMNHFEFLVKEPAEPAGLIRGISALSSWLYGGDPLLYMVNDDSFNELKQWLKTNQFETLLKEMFIDETGLVLLETIPSKTLGETRRIEEEKRVCAFVDQLDDEGKKELLDLNEHLITWQQTPDSKEALATLPVLSLSEVNDKPSPFNQKVYSTNNVPVLHNDLNTTGIVHAKLYFNITGLSNEQLSACEFLANVLGMLSTSKHSALEIAKLVKQHVGRLRFSVTAHSKDSDTSKASSYFVVSCSVLNEKTNIALDLIKEILFDTNLDQNDKLKEIVLQEDEAAMQELIAAGHTIAMCRTLAHHNASYAAKDYIGGFEYYRWLHDLAEHFDEKIEAVKTCMKMIVETYMVQSGLTVSKTTNADFDESVWIDAFEKGNTNIFEKEYKAAGPVKEGIVIPSQVSYSVAGCGLDTMDGSYLIAANILSYSYLWNVIRVQGGAYGTGHSIRLNKLTFAYSYRDPSPARSIEAYKGLGDALMAFIESDENLDKYIISTIANSDPLMTPRELGASLDAFYFRNYTYEDSCKNRLAMLHATKEGLKPLCKVLKETFDNPTICVVGTKNALEAFEDITYSKR